MVRENEPIVETDPPILAFLMKPTTSATSVIKILFN